MFYLVDSVIHLLENLGSYVLLYLEFISGAVRQAPSIMRRISLAEGKKLWNKALWSHKGHKISPNGPYTWLRQTNKFHHQASLALSWVPEVFLAARIFGVGRRPKPRAAKPSEKTHGLLIKTWQKPETALEKSLAPTVRLLNNILLHSVCIFISVKLRNFTISKRGMVVKLYLAGVNTHKGYWTSTF